MERARSSSGCLWTVAVLAALGCSSGGSKGGVAGSGGAAGNVTGGAGSGGAGSGGASGSDVDASVDASAAGADGAAGAGGVPGGTGGTSTGHQCSSLGLPCRSTSECGAGAICILNALGASVGTDVTVGTIALDGIGWAHGHGFCSTACRSNADCLGGKVEGACMLIAPPAGSSALTLSIKGAGDHCLPTCKSSACPAGLTCASALLECTATADPTFCAPCGPMAAVAAEATTCEPGQTTCSGDQASVCDCAGKWSHGACPDTCSAGFCTPHLTSIVANISQFCGTRPDGTPSCWGSGIPFPPLKLNHLALASSGRCALSDLGQALCSGTIPPSPVATDRFTDIAVAGSVACGLHADGTIACWGGLQPPPSGTFVGLAVASGAACAYTQGGAVTCWGPSTTTAGFVPPTGVVQSIVAARGITNDWFCGVQTDSSLQCWGNSNTVIQPPAGHFKSVSMAAGYGCGIKDDGSLQCWQSPTFTSPAKFPRPLQTPPGTNFKQVATGDFAACAVTTDDRVVCWGNGSQAAENVPPAK